jgi:hypothetical protein
MKSIRISAYLLSSFIFSLVFFTNSAYAEKSREHFDCKSENNIIYSIFVNPRAYKKSPKVIKWDKRSRKNNQDLCKAFSEAINSKISQDTQGYIIPGYDDTNQPVLCASQIEKNKRTKEIVCRKEDILISLISIQPNDALRKFYYAAFSKAYIGVLSQSSRALKEDQFGEPYIDMAKAVLHSVE